FWGFSSFFAGIQSRRLQDIQLPDKEDPKKRSLTIPGTRKVVQARFLDGAEPSWQSGVTPRAALAGWLTSASNPFFARATVDRARPYFCGTGLAEPIDEMVGSSSTTSHPELLDLLAREFAAHKFDLKFLVRALTATQAYQRTSALTHP